MLSTIGAALQTLFAVVGLSATPEPGLVAFAAVAVVAVAALALAAHVLGLPVLYGRSVAHPRRSIDVSAPLAQSDPDAAGHTRPRAPGLAASAA